MELNKSKSILNQKQEDLLTGTWTAVEDALFLERLHGIPQKFSNMGHSRLSRQQRFRRKKLGVA